MNTSFDFRDVYVFDLANNHQGDVEHALRIIEEVGAVVRARGVRGIFKFQFRQLDTFVHPAHQQNSPNKHIPRFLSTRLGKEDFRRLTEAVRRAGMITMSTPFDEESVDLIDELGIEVVKVASCSALDWPLLEKIATYTKPVIVSTGGLKLDDIDDLVSFLDHRRVHFALMHCVSIYPTPDHQLELNQIEVIRNRHPSKVVGFSTHEVPDELGAAMIAIAKGAKLLERHVGIATDKIKLNAYSSTPAQVDAWIAAAERARVMCGHAGRPAAPAEELASLASLKRGVFIRDPIKAGGTLRREDVYFAMPYAEGQLDSGQWKEGIVVNADLAKDAPVMLDQITRPAKSEKAVLFDVIHEVKAMLNEARIALNTDFRLEFSHHFGLAEFRKTGAVIIECMNRDYCKKLIVQLPGQYHPSHYHKKKEESFQVLHGTLEIILEGRRRTLQPGDIQLVPQGCWHEFWTDTGVIFEEVSTTHINNDSFYEDKRINTITREARKTIVNNWGRYQI
ncbi:MAG: N-acetylneuraminate synthase family protein [Candidatus Didemnitutus sp.]|nr:N-acetylneuraminate synthase family protein [Candidatus Didemnitutus sp.]